MHQYEDCIKKGKERLITAASNHVSNSRRKQQQKLENRNGKKNNCMNISSNKLAKSYKRIPEHGYEKETLRDKLNLFLIAAQNKAIRTNYITAKIDNTQQNSKFRLCGDNDKTINPIINKYSKLAQKEWKSRYDSVRKVIFWDL